MANTPVSVRLPEDLRSWLTERAAVERRSLNNLIVLLLEQAQAAESYQPAGRAPPHNRPQRQPSERAERVPDLEYVPDDEHVPQAKAGKR